MIASFTITNYLSISEPLTLSFETRKKYDDKDVTVTRMKDGKRLLKTAIIYGSNNTGKSNITKALDQFCRLMTEVPADPSTRLNIKKFAYDPQVYDDMPTTFSMDFYVNGLRYKMTVQIHYGVIFDEVLQAYLTAKPSTIYHRFYDKEGDKIKVDFGEKVGLSLKSQNSLAAMTHNNATMLATYGQASLERCLMKDAYDYFRTRFTGTFTSVKTMLNYAKELLAHDNDGKVKMYFEYMLKQVDFDIHSLSLRGSGDSKELVFIHEQNGIKLEVPEMEDGGGMRRYIGMCAWLYRQIVSPCMVCLDGLDKELHHKKRSYFFRCFLYNTRKESQLLFTTHSFRLLEKDYIPRDVIHVTKFGEYNSTILKPIRQMGIHSNVSLVSAYDEGKIDEFPIIGDHILDLSFLGLSKETKAAVEDK